MCGHLAAALCKSVVATWQEGVGEKGRVVGNTDVSDYAKAEEALCAIGVMHQGTLRDGNGRNLDAFSMNADEMPSYLASRIPEGDPRIELVLRAFIRVACCYGEALTDERGWFRPPPRYATAMQWLSKCGYAQHRTGAFRWTEKIGPAMRSSYLWTEDNRSTTTLRREHLMAECEAVWQAMPDTLRRAITTKRITLLELTAVLARGWKNGQWRSFNRDEPVRLTGQIALAGALIECGGDFG